MKDTIKLEDLGEGILQYIYIYTRQMTEGYEWDLLKRENTNGQETRKGVQL